MEKLVSITFPFSSAGKQLEQLTLETLKQQQDALHKLTSGVDELEKELQQFTAQFNNQYTDYVKQLTGNSLNDQINEWQEKWKELSAHMQQLTVSPTKTSLSILTQTSGQFEETTKQFIEQQQLQREEAQKQLEGFGRVQVKAVGTRKKFEENSKIYLLPSSKKNVGAHCSTNKTLSSSYYIKMASIFDMEKKEDKMNPFQEAQTVPELRYDEIQVGDQASLTKRLRMRTLSILQN